MVSQASLRTIFFGSPAFVQPVLDALREGTDLQGIVSTPGAPFPAEYAQLHHLKQWAPNDLKDEAFLRQLRRTKPDFIVTLAYGKIIPTTILSLPTIYPLNIHYSLLPEYRGATPVQTALLDDKTSSGITLQVMAAEMDAGDILWQESLPLLHADTSATVFARFTAHMATQLCTILNEIASKQRLPQPQNHDLATYCDKSLFVKEKARINWEQTTAAIHNFVRAFYPEPIAFTEFTAGEKKMNVNIIEGAATFPAQRYDNHKIGTWILEGKNIFVKTTNGYYQILKLQPAGKKVQSASEFINGYRRFLEPI